jgi:hypothetical protein
VTMTPQRYLVAWRASDGSWRIDPRPHTRDSAQERTAEREAAGFTALAADLNGVLEHLSL